VVSAVVGVGGYCPFLLEATVLGLESWGEGARRGLSSLRAHGCSLYHVQTIHDLPRLIPRYIAYLHATRDNHKINHAEHPWRVPNNHFSLPSKMSRPVYRIPNQ
jgi:hypothetical protein